jgi:hypothetical protein
MRRETPYSRCACGGQNRPLILKLALDYMKCWRMRFFHARLMRQWSLECT